ncbi:MAG: hypothetical protein QM503_15130 [Bacteroidota bacterium]
MKKWFKIIVIAAIIGFGGLAYIWFFVYNKPHQNIEKATPDFIISSNECYNSYTDGNSTGLSDYTGKVLQITGVPTSIESNDSLVVLVFVFNQGMFGDEGIRCTMLPSYIEKSKNINLLTPITIKGYCSGYNDTDVVLEQCSIIKQ